MGTSADAPWTDMSYKMVEYAGRPVQKLSTGKISWPGKKQVFRHLDDRGRLRKDVLGLRYEKLAAAQPLLEKVMEHGRALQSPPLTTSRELFLDEFHRLDDSVKAIRSPAAYPIEYSDALRDLERQLGETIHQRT